MVTLSTGVNSKQDYRTPPEFIDAVEKRFGPICFDLAADYDNAQPYHGHHLEYQFKYFYSQEMDSLKQDWAAQSKNWKSGLMWLNPPFSKIAPWAQKCAEYVTAKPNRHVKIALLVPAAVGSNWFRDYVWPHALIYFLNGRITFDGCTGPFPKDCLLAIYEHTKYMDDRQPEIWQWRVTE